MSVLKYAKKVQCTATLDFVVVFVFGHSPGAVIHQVVAAIENNFEFLCFAKRLKSSPMLFNSVHPVFLLIVYRSSVSAVFVE